MMINWQLVVDLLLFDADMFFFFLEQGLDEMKKLLLLLLGCAVQVKAQFTALKHLHTSHMHI